jgi:hypothetical protein
MAYGDRHGHANVHSINLMLFSFVPLLTKTLITVDLFVRNEETAMPTTKDVTTSLRHCSSVKVTFLVPDTLAFEDSLEFKQRREFPPHDPCHPVIIAAKQNAATLEQLRQAFSCRYVTASISSDGEKPRVTFIFERGIKKKRKGWYGHFRACIQQSPLGLFDIEIFTDRDRSEMRFYCKPTTMR